LSDEYPHLISGSIDIVDNFIDGMYRRAGADDPWAAPSYGILVRGLTQGGIWLAQYEADVNITGNAVYNMGIVGILSGGNNGTTQLSNNNVDMGPADAGIRPDSEGISAFGGYFYDGHATAKYVISGNDVDMGNNPEAWGIHVDSTENYPVIRENRIRVRSDSGVGIVMWDTSNATVRENQVQGNGLAGVALLTPGWLSTDDNTIKENKVDSFRASSADYYLADDVFNNTLYVKTQDTVLDESGNDTNTVILYD
jgi:parallel beta-helix repeat protein